MEPRYNDPRYNDIPGITMKILCPSQSYSKMYGKNPDITIFDVTITPIHDDNLMDQA